MSGNAFIDPSLLGAGGSSAAAGSSSAGEQQPAGSSSTDEIKKAEERARKDRTLVDFMELLDGYEPVVRYSLLVALLPARSSLLAPACWQTQLNG